MNEIDAIWDAALKAGELIHREDAIRKKREQIRSVLSETCGNCSHWMKTSCVPEKQHGQFKSISSPACELFELCPLSERLANDFQKELVELQTMNPSGEAV